jgi:hypothetical protein
MKFDRSNITKIKYQIKEGKFRVADWAVLELIEYIEYLENRVVMLTSLEIMDKHKDLLRKLAKLEEE